MPIMVATRAAAFIAKEARAAVAARTCFVMAVSGGSTPWLMLRALAGVVDGDYEVIYRRHSADFIRIVPLDDAVGELDSENLEACTKYEIAKGRFGVRPTDGVAASMRCQTLSSISSLDRNAETSYQTAGAITDLIGPRIRNPSIAGVAQKPGQGRAFWLAVPRGRHYRDWALRIRRGIQSR
jgi:hypothetical protein